MGVDTLVKQQFLRQLDPVASFQSLFEHIPELSFFAKDAEGHFVMGNQTTAQICGCRQEEDILGKTDYDFFPKDIAESFLRDDVEVIRTGKEIIDRCESIPGGDGAIRWYSTIKVPLYNKLGSVIGVAGTSRRVPQEAGAAESNMEFSEIIHFVSEHYSEPIEVKTLAQMASLSVSQFERRFKRVYKETPSQFIIKVRISAACRALAQTRKSIHDIAGATGFFDQSYLSKMFAKRMGMTPRKYRQKFFQGFA